MKKEGNINNICNKCIFFAKESAKTNNKLGSIENLPFCRNPEMLLIDKYSRIKNKIKCEHFMTKALQDET